MEVLDPRRATAGWQPVPNWSFPGAAKDQCTVATRYLSVRRPEEGVLKKFSLAKLRFSVASAGYRGLGFHDRPVYTAG